MSGRVRLGVNIDHVATLRNARGGIHPDPVRAAEAALAAGADGVVAHLREDRRHVRDADVEALVEHAREAGREFHLEMAATEEMLRIALDLRPSAVCLVPERREELTTEGGLDVVGRRDEVVRVTRALREAGSRVSLFVEPDAPQIAASADMGAHAVELHTGAYCAAAGVAGEAERALDALRRAARAASARGLEVHAGHGLDYATAATVSAIPEIAALNIGHFLVGEAVFDGLAATVARMRATIDGAGA